MKLYLILGVIILILAAVVYLLVNKGAKQKKKIKELERRLEIEETIKEKTKKIRTTNNTANFNNSIDILQNYSKNK